MFLSEWRKRRRRAYIRTLVELVDNSYKRWPWMPFEWHYLWAQREYEWGLVRHIPR